MKADLQNKKMGNGENKSLKEHLFGTIRSRFIFYSAVIALIFSVAFITLSWHVMLADQRILKEMEQLSEQALDLGTGAVEDVAKLYIEEQAEHTADMIGGYFLRNPNATFEDMRNDRQMKEFSVHRFMETGYTAVHNRDAVSCCHPDPKIEGTDLQDLAHRFPDFWKIIEMSLYGEASGYYIWEDLEGNIRNKYMHCEPAGNTELVVCATLYVDELVTPVRALQRKLSLEIEDTKSSIDHQVRLLILVMTVMSILLITGLIIAAYLSTRHIVNPLYEIYTATQRVQKGDFEVRTDISTGDEMEDVGEAFNRMTEQLQTIDKERKQLDAAKTTFMSITSHELRSPITPMKAQLQMFKGDYFGKLNEKQENSLDIVLRNTERLDRIIEDFLEISRIEAARLKFDFKKTDLKPHIKRIVKEMDGFLPEKKIKIITDIGDLPKVEIDPDRVMQVLRNLINNAKKFSHKGGRIWVSAHEKQDFIEFKVRDEGIGIKKKDTQKLFEPFYQAEHTMSRKYGGTGLGLSICKGIVEAQNGRMNVKSTYGKGTIFTFTFPKKPVKEVKPIKILFSAQEDIESKLKDLFREVMGPLGELEFDEFAKGSKLTKEVLFKYVDDMLDKNVLVKENAEKLKKGITNIYRQRHEQNEKKEKEGTKGFGEEMGKYFEQDKKAAGKDDEKPREAKEGSKKKSDDKAKKKSKKTSSKEKKESKKDTGKSSSKAQHEHSKDEKDQSDDDENKDDD
ncbi:HAMP domain-containing protein [Candidatus Woesearchaeota archaeon]|nr:HAMP domain-containing protein [Candidatus Woesearchaeota archaeon]